MTKRTSSSGPIAANETAYVELTGGATLKSLNPEQPDLTDDDDDVGSLRRTNHIMLNVNPTTGSNATAAVSGVAAGRAGQELIIDSRDPTGDSRVIQLSHWSANAKTGEKVLTRTTGKVAGGSYQFLTFSSLHMIYIVEPAVDEETPPPEPHWRVITATALPTGE